MLFFDHKPRLGLAERKTSGTFNGLQVFWEAASAAPSGMKAQAKAEMRRRKRRTTYDTHNTISHGVARRRAGCRSGRRLRPGNGGRARSCAGGSDNDTRAIGISTTGVRAEENSEAEVATFAAGCFWSMEAIFEQLKGVEKVEPGYAGGRTAKPSYEQVGTGKTGHAETFDITFDPDVISYRDLLEVLFTVHDPTTLNKQGADVGTQYRSAIFYRSEEQKKTAQKAISEIAARLWKKPIVTTVQPFTNFYRAEDYHQDYYKRNPKESYCTFVIGPKMEKVSPSSSRNLSRENKPALVRKGG